MRANVNIGDFVLNEDIAKILYLIEKDVRKGAEATEAKGKFEYYLGYTKSLLDKYGLHPAVTKEIKKKYIKELTAISFFEAYIKASWCEKIDFNQMYPEKRFYNWYEISPKIKARISRLNIIETPEVPQFFAEIVQILFNSTKKSFGEFYTPTQTAEFLVSSLGKPRDIFDQRKSIIDPSCGIGTLLGVTINNILKDTNNKKINKKEFLDFIYKDVRGFDIQPFAVISTRLQLSAILFSEFRDAEINPDILQIIFKFPKIELKDSLTVAIESADKKVDFIIANPPYGKISVKKVPNQPYYEKILNGHPNLYQLFLWWSVNAVNERGKIVFLLPQSFTSGLYNHKLRKEVELVSNVDSITKFTNRSGIFPDVQHPLMVISLSKRQNEPKQEYFVSISITAKKQNSEEIIKRRIKEDKLIRKIGEGLPWCISNNPVDYDILSKVYGKSINIKGYEKISLKNGGFVWNQNKKKLHLKKQQNNLPLIYASVIKPYTFNFEEHRIDKKRFVSTPRKFEALQYSTPSILIRRTVPKSSGQKIYACMVPKEFIEEHQAYFVENHVNVVKLKEDTQSNAALWGVTAWLNSNLLNFIFNSINGNSHISIYELSSLPINGDLIRKVTPLVRKINFQEKGKLEKSIENLNNTINSHFELTETEISRLNECFQQQGVGKNAV